MKHLFKNSYLIIALVFTTTLISCSNSLEEGESRDLIMEHLEKKGKHFLEFRFKKYNKVHTYKGRSGCQLQKGSALEVSKSLGLLNVNVSYSGGKCIIETSLTSKAKNYVIEEKKKWDGSTIAKVVGGNWQLPMMGGVTGIFEEGNGYRVETEEVFRETIFNPYFFRGGRYDTNGGKLYKDGDTRTSSYYIQLNSDGEWKIR